MHHGRLITVAVVLGAGLVGIGLAALLGGGRADRAGGLPAAAVKLERFEPPAVSRMRVPTLRTTAKRAETASEPKPSSSPSSPAASPSPSSSPAPVTPSTPAKPVTPKPAPDVIGETEGGSG